MFASSCSLGGITGELHKVSRAGRRVQALRCPPNHLQWPEEAAAVPRLQPGETVTVPVC